MPASGSPPVNKNIHPDIVELFLCQSWPLKHDAPADTTPQSPLLDLDFSDSDSASDSEPIFEGYEGLEPQDAAEHRARYDYWIYLQQKLSRVFKPLRIQCTDTILAFGSGYSADLSLRAASVTSLEPDPTRADILFQLFPKSKIYPIDALELNQYPELQQQSFDKIFAHGKLNILFKSHLEREKCILASFNALKPGGMMLATLGAAGHCSDVRQALNMALWNRGVEMSVVRDAVPWRLPVGAEVCVYFKKAGFRAVRVVVKPEWKILDGGEGAELEDWVRWYCKPFWKLVKKGQHEAIVKEICLDIVKKSDEKKRPIGVRYVQMQVLARKPKEVLKNDDV